MYHRLLLPLGLLFFLTSPTLAENIRYRGVSSFAALHPKFPCDRFLQISANAKYPALTVLWDTFGKDPTCARRFFEKFKDRPTFLQVHFSNEVCRKDGRCIDNAFPNDNTREYNRRLEKFDEATYGELWNRLQEILFFIYTTANPNTYVVIGGGLEDRYSKRAWENLGHFLYFNIPFALSRNPSGGDKSKDYAASIETHSTRATPTGNCIANEDGNDQDSSESKAFMRHYRKCLASFVWRSSHQGYIVGKPKPPHKDRTFAISASDVRKLSKILREAP